jgi:hypothetical protein
VIFKREVKNDTRSEEASFSRKRTMKKELGQRKIRI